MRLVFSVVRYRLQGRIVRGMRCRHLSVHGCNFESDRRRIVGSCSSVARGALGSYGDRTQGNSNGFGGEVVHRLMLGLVVEAPAPAGEQLRTTYTERYRTRVPFRTPEREVAQAAQRLHKVT